MNAAEEIFDVAIVGLGPAGSTFARLLSPNFKVVAFDKKSADPAAGGFQKPCGGLLAEDAQKALSRQGLALPKSVLVAAQLFSVRTIDLHQNLEKTYRRFYVNMCRHRFDLWLKSLVPESAKIFNETGIRKISFGNDKLWEIRFFQEKREKIVKAKMLVGADGAASLTRKTLFPEHKIRCYSAIQKFFKNKQSAPIYACFFDETLTDCYGWAVAKNDELLFGAAFPRNKTAGAFEKLREKAEKFGFVLDEEIRSEACHVLRPEKMRDFKIGDPAKNAFLIGEAAGFISPSSLEGISYALDSAEILADAFNEIFKNANAAGTRIEAEKRGNAAEKIFEKYRSRSRKIRLKLLSKIMKNPFMYAPKIRKIVMKSGISALKIR